MKKLSFTNTDQVSLVITVLNEAVRLPELLTAIDAQTQQPDEIIIIDGGSTDASFEILKTWQHDNHNKKHILQYTSSISQARNKGIELASHEWIAMTDAGCVPQGDWLEQLVAAKNATSTASPTVSAKKISSANLIFAGTAVGLPTNAFETAMIPFILPKKIDLAATRSVLFHRKIWQIVGGFREDLAVSEDYVFFKTAHERGFGTTVVEQAIVGWYPRNTMQAFCRMVAAQARYDAIGGVTRPKVYLIFVRYSIAFALLLFLFFNLEFWLVTTTVVTIGTIIYAAWAIFKHKRYYGNIKNGNIKTSWQYAPVFQISSDGAVMWGTAIGLCHSILNSIFN